MAYKSFTRPKWAALASSTNIDVITTDIPILSQKEIDDIYTPLVHFLNLLYQQHHQLHTNMQHFFNNPVKKIPFLISIAGSVSAGKSTFSEVLAALFHQLPEQPMVTILSTDQFLFRNTILEEKQLTDLKGFPESYDWVNLEQTLEDIKRGETVEAPIYSHEVYDILTDQTQTIASPDILIVEGINTLQTGTNGEAIQEHFDISLYLDAEEDALFSWFWKRVNTFKDKAKDDPTSYYYAFKDMNEDELYQLAKSVWDNINGKNLHEHILPTKQKADIIIKKASDHSIQEVRIKESLC